MSALILRTKLYIPPPPVKAVPRPRLTARLNAGLQRQLTLVSAPAGFGKTTLVSSWAAASDRPVAWLSLDAGDNDPARFLAYLVAALRTVAPQVGDGVLGVLQAPHPLPAESVLTPLLNDLASLPDPVVLVLDDYHVITAPAVDQALAFLLEHLPPQLRLLIATREDLPLPLARLRARDQLTELRVADLRFTSAETADFLNEAMGLTLAADDIAALDARTEGWIAGLQLAAISLLGHEAPGSFVRSFTGSHRFVMDYLVEEVLQQQPEPVQTFLLHTSILDRLCGPLCDTVLGDRAASGQATLEYLDHANLFIIPLDSERRWYRYHHLFADLLRQRLQQHLAATGGAAHDLNALHIRASQWYEDHDLDIEAFHHAAAANDVARAERLIQGQGIPLHLRGAVTMILDWFASLPANVLDARPSLWWRYAGLLLVGGQTTGVEEKLNAAEGALLGQAEDAATRHLIGRIAAARATLALTRYQTETMLAESRRALEYLPAENATTRANALWTMGYGYLMQGERAAARQALTDAVALSRSVGDIFTTILATIGLGNIAEVDNRLDMAAEIYRQILDLAGDQPVQIVYEAHLGLARVLYEWNDLAGAEQHGRQALHLARQYERVIDRFVVCEVFLARLQLARGDLAGAVALLADADRAARQQNFVYRIPEVAAAQVPVLLRQGQVDAAAEVAQRYDLPLSQARVHLAQGDAAAALTVLAPTRQQAEARSWADERLKALVLQALAHQAGGDSDQAARALEEALALAEPGGFIRLFVDEGPPMGRLLADAAARRIRPGSVEKLRAAFAAEDPRHTDAAPPRPPPRAQPLVEPLTQRELEILHLIAEGRSNREIGERLFLALDTVKGHNQQIFGKLHVQRRTEAVARARELGLV